MLKRDYTAIPCRPAKLTAPESLFAHHVVKTLRDSFAVFKYGSLYSAVFPCAASKRRPFKKDFGLTQLQHAQPTTKSSKEFCTSSWFIGSLGKDVMRGCEQVVGKDVTKLVQNFKLYKLGMDDLVFGVKYVFSVRRLLAVYAQAIDVCTHSNSWFVIDRGIFLYTLPTGPTNTNNLIKG